jgi:hypothetical protein
VGSPYPAPPAPHHSQSCIGCFRTPHNCRTPPRPSPAQGRRCGPQPGVPLVPSGDRCLHLQGPVPAEPAGGAAGGGLEAPGAPGGFGAVRYLVAGWVTADRPEGKASSFVTRTPSTATSRGGPSGKHPSTRFPCTHRPRPSPRHLSTAPHCATATSGSCVVAVRQ